MKVDNAIIMAAGTSSRFVPLSYEKHKALIEVKGEVLIERQIRQLREAGINQIVVVTGYKAEEFGYLAEKFGVILIYNPYYLTRNNNSSIHATRKYLKNSYVCSADNYFCENPFAAEVDESYYAAAYSEGETKEWCLETDENEYIRSVRIGGSASWYMLGHTFWREDFSREFLNILDGIFDKPEIADLLWESIYMEHMDKLKMKIRKYPKDYIFEFDTLDELREFDRSYVYDTRSEILKRLSMLLDVDAASMHSFAAVKDKDNAAAGFCFCAETKNYIYMYATRQLQEITE